MLRRLPRTALLGASMTLALSATPALAGAQAFQSCSSAGVCGWVDAVLTGTNLRVRVQNSDATTGSALFHVAIGFANNLTTNASPAASDAAMNGTTTLGTVGGWYFGSQSGVNVLDLSSFFNAYIEGSAVSSYRYPVSLGTWVTGGSNDFVEFNGDLSGIGGVSGNSIKTLGFETEYGYVEGTATPEPASFVLFGTGLAALGLRLRRRRSES